MNTHCIVYRTGGTENFQWQRSAAMSRDEAEKGKAEVERMGYKALVCNYQSSLAIGLPETFDATT